MRNIQNINIRYGSGVPVPCDPEDYVQSISALESFADCIVTRNKKDFWKSVIPVYTIEELMSLM